jgi:hypothetical protein
MEEHYYVVTDGEDRNFFLNHVVSFEPLITPSVIEVTREQFEKDIDRPDFMVWFSDIKKICYGFEDLREKILIYKLSKIQ